MECTQRCRWHRASRLAGMFVIAGLTAVASNARADSGSFEGISAFGTDYARMEFNNGTTVTGGGLRGTFSVTRAEGGLFAPTLDVAGECVVFAKKTAAGIDLEAPCTFTESTTDRWYWVTSRRTGDMAAGGEGRAEIVRGTGKYAGIIESRTYSTSYFPGNRGATRFKCRWQRN